MKKGQALIEFIIILPIILLLILGITDYVRITLLKSELDSLLPDTVNMYKEGKTLTEIENYINKNIDATLTITNTNDEYLTLTISKKINLFTPGLNKILDNPYSVSVDRVFYEK